VDALTCRLLPFAVADGPRNMAADEVLLRSATRRRASLRFYDWSEPTVSLGYFQPHARRLEDPLLADLPFVRRPTGGDALVHHHELTYCLAVPAGPPWQYSEPWLRMHVVIATALAEFGVDARLHVPSGEDRFTGFLCFQHLTAGDLTVGASKVMGSAQRRQRGAVMQHGGILLARSPFTPTLPGIRELSGRDVDPGELSAAIVRHLERQTGWDVRPEDWSDEERRAVEELAAERYASDAWNRKR
jgi:lipoate-protein ligase A